jgi:methylenetetrahydrofolate dehydrogenase (NADP+)/methenyltetrahydrofolate cyclohydrolase
MPSAALFLQKNATVVVCHSKTDNLGEVLGESDVIVSATGSPHVVRPELVKPGVALVDVGIRRTDNGKVAGDLDTAAFSDVAGHVSTVPGGVGPLTVAFLMQNTLIAYLTAAHRN